MSNYRLGFENEDVRSGRRSKDTVVNSSGKSLMNLCFLLDCVILNGCCNDDRKVLPHGSGAIDYLVELCWSNTDKAVITESRENREHGQKSSINYAQLLTSSIGNVHE